MHRPPDECLFASSKASIATTILSQRERGRDAAGHARPLSLEGSSRSQRRDGGWYAQDVRAMRSFLVDGTMFLFHTTLPEPAREKLGLTPADARPRPAPALRGRVSARLERAAAATALHAARLSRARAAAGGAGAADAGPARRPAMRQRLVRFATTLCSNAPPAMARW